MKVFYAFNHQLLYLILQNRFSLKYKNYNELATKHMKRKNWTGIHLTLFKCCIYEYILRRKTTHTNKKVIKTQPLRSFRHQINDVTFSSQRSFSCVEWHLMLKIVRTMFVLKLKYSWLIYYSWRCKHNIYKWIR